MHREHSADGQKKENRTVWTWIICRLMGDGRMVKKMIFGTMGEKNRRGRPRKEWLDDIMEWG